MGIRNQTCNSPRQRSIRTPRLSGEFGISILLKDQDSHSGTTSFVRGSHRFGVRASDAKAEFYLKPSILKHFSEPAKGQAGDVFLLKTLGTAEHKASQNKTQMQS